MLGSRGHFIMNERKLLSRLVEAENKISEPAQTDEDNRAQNDNICQINCADMIRIILFVFIGRIVLHCFPVPLPHSSAYFRLMPE